MYAGDPAFDRVMIPDPASSAVTYRLGMDESSVTALPAPALAHQAEDGEHSRPAVREVPDEEGGIDMSSITHEPVATPEPRRGWSGLVVREMWAALAIIVMWLTVLLTALFGPDIVTTSAGGDASTVPSAVPVALFVLLATWVVARYGFGRRGGDAG